MSKVEWTQKSITFPYLSRTCQQLTDDGYWIYGVYPREDGNGFTVLACKNFSNE